VLEDCSCNVTYGLVGGQISTKTGSA